MERIDRQIRTVYGKDLHDSHMSVTVRLDTDSLEHGDKIEVVTRKANSDDNDEQETDQDN